MTAKSRKDHPAHGWPPCPPGCATSGSAVHENRRLNRRVAELTDVVAELLVPLADRDEEKARELLARYRETSLAP